ncbi:hypothetical protein ACJX0J_034760, partial [Zea mays]
MDQEPLEVIIWTAPEISRWNVDRTALGWKEDKNPNFSSHTDPWDPKRGKGCILLLFFIWFFVMPNLCAMPTTEIATPAVTKKSILKPTILLEEKKEGKK